MAIEYRGKKFPGYNKPVKSDRPEKKGMVLAKEGEKVRLIHFGDSSMGHNYSPEAPIVTGKREPIRSFSNNLYCN